MFKHPKKINELGGIQLEHEYREGSVYAPPDTDLHARALAGDFGPVAPYTPPPPQGPSRADVNAERDRRIAAGVTFGGTVYDSRDEDKKRLTGAASLAHIALTLNGKHPGDLRWHDGEQDFGWIARDNSITAMDAPTVLAFGAAMAKHESAHVFAARALKDHPEGIPDDYADDKYWPEEPK